MPHIPPIYLILFALFTDILGEKQKNTRLLYVVLNLLNAELNPICHLLALLGAHPILHISKIRVKKQHKNYFLVRIRSLSLVHKQYKAIIIIIIWHYSPLWVFTFSAKSLQVLLSLAVSFPFLTLSFFRSSMTSSNHHCCLPTGLVPIILLRGIVHFPNIQPAILDWDFIENFVFFFWNWMLALCPTPILGDQDLSSGFSPLDGLASPSL